MTVWLQGLAFDSGKQSTVGLSFYSKIRSLAVVYIDPSVQQQGRLGDGRMELVVKDIFCCPKVGISLT